MLNSRVLPIIMKFYDYFVDIFRPVPNAYTSTGYFDIWESFHEDNSSYEYKAPKSPIAQKSVDLALDSVQYPYLDLTRLNELYPKIVNTVTNMVKTANLHLLTTVEYLITSANQSTLPSATGFLAKIKHDNYLQLNIQCSLGQSEHPPSTIGVSSSSEDMLAELDLQYIDESYISGRSIFFSTNLLNHLQLFTANGNTKTTEIAIIGESDYECGAVIPTLKSGIPISSTLRSPAKTTPLSRNRSRALSCRILYAPITSTKPLSKENTGLLLIHNSTNDDEGLSQGSPNNLGPDLQEDHFLLWEKIDNMRYPEFCADLESDEVSDEGGEGA